jgi:hypothetical protein
MRRSVDVGVATLALLLGALALTPLAASAASAPTASTGAASGLTDTQASLAGTVNPQGQLTSYAFQYGTTTAYGEQSPLASAGSGTADVPVTANLSGLTPGTTYHYRVIATNASGTTVGGDRTFATTGTAPPPAPKPSVTTGRAIVSGASATVTGSVNPNGRDATYYFELGETAGYGQQTPPQSAGAGTLNVAVAAALPGLKAGTTYHDRLVAVGPGNAVAVGADATFTTGPASRLAVFGHTAFVEQHGVAGVFAACVGTATCTGGMRLERSGQLLGARMRFTIAPDDGGFVHFSLNPLGQALLRHRGALRVRVTLTPASGPSVSTVVVLIRFPRFGLRG